MGNLWGTLARVKGVKGGGYFMPMTQNDTELQGIPCPLHKTTLHYKVFHAHYTKRHCITKRHRITRDPMPITQNDIGLQGIPCPLHKTTLNYKVFRYRNCFGTETVSAPELFRPPELFRYRNCFGTETVSHPPGGRWQTAAHACRPHVFVRGLSRNSTFRGRSASVSGPKQTETGHERSQVGFGGTETAGIRRTVRRVLAVSVPKQPRVPPQHYWWTFRRNINGGGKSCVVSCNGHGIPCNPVSFYAMRMEYLVTQCRFVQWAQHTL